MQTLRVAVAVASIVHVCTFAIATGEPSDPPLRECFDFAPAPEEPIIPASQVTEEPQIESQPPYPRDRGHTPAHYPREMDFEITLDSTGTVTRVCGPQNVSDTKGFCVSLGRAKFVPARVDETPVATVIAVKFKLHG